MGRFLIKIDSPTNLDSPSFWIAQDPLTYVKSIRTKSEKPNKTKPKRKLRPNEKRRDLGNPKNLGISEIWESQENLGTPKISRVWNLGFSRIWGFWESQASLESQESGDLGNPKNLGISGFSRTPRQKNARQTPVFGYFFGPSSLTLKFLWKSTKLQMI